MAKEKIKMKNEESKNNKVSCADQFCPTHGKNAVKLRGRTFEGEVINKLAGRLKIEFERVLYDKKYERFDKRRTRIHARLPDCMANDIQLGDWIQIRECRPLSKIIHFYVVKKIRSKQEKIVGVDVGLENKPKEKKQ
jgi:small subunit ribosomal protein S17